MRGELGRASTSRERFPLSPAGGAFNKPVMVTGHIALASMLVFRFRQLDSSSLASVKKFYRSIWDLFYLEYIMYPFI